MKSVMSHDFSRIPATAISRSRFDRSHGHKTAFDAGYLVPIELQEILPSDDVDITTKILGRLMPVVSSPMDNLHLDTFWFFVPSRLVWSNFVKMMGERVSPGDSIDYLVPQINSGETGFAENSLADYFGIPTKVPNLNVNALPFRAYQKIYDDWFRDENLQNSVITDSSMLGDGGNDNVEWTTLRRRGKRKDYFSSALPFPQKGESVRLPLGTYAPVVGNGTTLGLTDGTNNVGLGIGSTGSFYGVPGNYGVAVGSASGAPLSGATSFGVTSDKDKSGMVVDLSSATAASINAIRMAFQTQMWMEQQARGGSRYCEVLRTAFKTISPDARLQRSEFLGSTSEIINWNPVYQTSSTDTTSPQGNITANPKIYSEGHIRKAFTEHGYLICLANIRADLNYQQGLNRMFSRRSRFDFYWPVFAHLGEQEVLNKEIFAQGDSVTDSDGNIVDNLPFGYQERYAEYRYAPSIITGRMRSNATGSLDVWHLAQDFENLPVLNADFIEDNPPIDRIIAVTDEPQFYCDIYFQSIWIRPMPIYSVPGLVDHL